MTVEDEIALLADDIRRWAGPDARIHEALDQLLKIYEAEVNALTWEAVELGKKVALTRLLRDSRIGELDGVCEVCTRPCTGRWCRRCEHGGGLALTPYEVESGIQ